MEESSKFASAFWGSMDRAATACKVLPFSQSCQDLEEKSTAVVSTSSKMGHMLLLKCHIIPLKGPGLKHICSIKHQMACGSDQVVQSWGAVSGVQLLIQWLDVRQLRQVELGFDEHLSQQSSAMCWSFLEQQLWQFCARDAECMLGTRWPHQTGSAQRCGCGHRAKMMKMDERQRAKAGNTIAFGTGCFVDDRWW